KLVYLNGLKELERSVLALAAALCRDGKCHEDLPSLLSAVAPHVLDDLPAYRWYTSPAGEKFPIQNQPASIRGFANALRQEMSGTGTICVHLAARVVLERQFNRMVDGTRNKAAALFSTTAIHLDHLLRTYGQRGLVIFCDRHGGRGHYGSLLRLMFDEWSLEI